MRGTLMRRWSANEHTAILLDNPSDHDATVEYNTYDRGLVTRGNVEYWRRIFIFNDGKMAPADRQLILQRQLVMPLATDDIPPGFNMDLFGTRILHIPDLHAPYHHPDALDFLKAVADTLQPDLVMNTGDESDGHALSFHDSDPNLESAGTELTKARKFLKQLHAEFPDMLLCDSNHGSLIYRRAKAFGIPVQMVKRYRDILLPGIKSNGWAWRAGWTVQTPCGPVTFKHQSAGSPLQDAAHNRCNLVVGHLHGKFNIEYGASESALYWALTGGCLIDHKSLAFAYGKNARSKPIVGCSAIIDGVPHLIPMLLDSNGRWMRGKLGTI